MSKKDEPRYVFELPAMRACIAIHQIGHLQETYGEPASNRKERRKKEKLLRSPHKPKRY